MRNKRSVLLMLGTTLTIASGVLHGYMNQRWGADERLQDAAAHLSELPQRIGAWQLQSEEKLSDNAVKMLQCVSYLNHIYRNAEANRQVHVTVMVGPGSTMAIHTPEICYESRNFSLLGAKRSIDISDKNGGKHKLWAVDFQTNDTSVRNLRVHYGWSNGDSWTAPDRPRIAFAGERVLYKLQVAEFVYAIDSTTEGATSEFLNGFLPILQKHLVPEGS